MPRKPGEAESRARLYLVRLSRYGGSCKTDRDRAKACGISHPTLIKYRKMFPWFAKKESGIIESLKDSRPIDRSTEEEIEEYNVELIDGLDHQLSSFIYALRRTGDRVKAMEESALTLDQYDDAIDSNEVFSAAVDKHYRLAKMRAFDAVAREAGSNAGAAKFFFSLSPDREAQRPVSPRTQEGLSRKFFVGGGGK